MTWLDQELLNRKGQTSPLTTGIALFLGAIFFIPLVLAVLEAVRKPGFLAPMILLGFLPFLVWFLVGALRGFR